METDFPQRFVDLREIYIRDRDRWEKRNLASSRLVSGRPVVRFENVTTPEEAARLTNREVAIPKSQVVALPDDTYYVFDLIDCEVLEEGTDSLIGRVVDVERYPIYYICYSIYQSNGYVVHTRIFQIKQYPKVDQV